MVMQVGEVFSSKLVNIVLPGWFQYHGVRSDCYPLLPEQVFPGRRPPVAFKNYMNSFYPNVYGSGITSGVGLLLMGEGAYEAAAHALWVVVGRGIMDGVLPRTSCPFAWGQTDRLADLAFASDKSAINKIRERPFLVLEGGPTGETTDRLMGEILRSRVNQGKPTFLIAPPETDDTLYDKSGKVILSDFVSVEVNKTPHQRARQEAMEDLEGASV